MTFKPKGKDQIHKEVTEKFEKKGLDSKENKEIIDDTVNDLVKSENLSASLHKQKGYRDASANNAKASLKKLGFDKNGKPIKKADPKKDKQDKGSEDKDIISEEDKAYFFSKDGTRTELSFIRKTMKAEECDFNKAWKSNLFTAMKSENDKKIERRDAQHGAARGGGHKKKETDEDKTVEKFSNNLPRGFSADKPKSK